MLDKSLCYQGDHQYYYLNNPNKSLDGAITFVGDEVIDTIETRLWIEMELRRIVQDARFAMIYTTGCYKKFENFCHFIVAKTEKVFGIHFKEIISLHESYNDKEYYSGMTKAFYSSDLYSEPYVQSEWYKRAKVNVERSRYIFIHLNNANDEVLSLYNYAKILEKVIIIV